MRKISTYIVYIILLIMTSSLALANGDTIPPTTNISGVSEGGNYSKNVTITLIATDNVGGSGVNITQYTINDSQTYPYTAPFNVSNEGHHIIKYWSVDNASNTENASTINFTVDKTKPIITAPPNVTVNSITMGNNSILTSVNIGTPIVSDNLDENPIITNNSPSAGFPIGTTKVTWTATDHARNNATADQFVTVLPYNPIITDFKVTPNTHISGSNPAIASANVVNGVNNTTLVEFGIIDNKNLTGNGVVVLAFYRNFSGIEGLYKSEPWPANYANIGNTTISDAVSLYQASDIPGYILGRGTFKSNSTSDETEAILWFNKTTGNLSNVTKRIAEGGDKLDIDEGNSTFRTKMFKYINKSISQTPEYVSEKIFTLYNIAGNLSKNNPHVIPNTVPNGNYKVYVRAEDNTGNSTILLIDIDTVPVPTPSSGSGGGGGTGFNSQGNGTLNKTSTATATPTQTPTIIETPVTTITRPEETVKPEKTEGTKPKPTETPGFEIAIAIGTISAIYILRRKRR